MTDPPPLGAPYCHKRTTRAIAGRSPSHAVGSGRISRMRCPACRTETRPGVRFCEECGATLDVLCPACGAGVPTGKKFGGGCGAPLAAAAPPAPAVASPRFESPRAYTPAHLAARILKDRAALSGERKQVSVLFADVSGFTSISERLDPEEVHALINRAFELMLAEIHRYEGTVNQFLGDGLMALFGAPIAHEDHAQRAAHAALAMQQTLARYRDELQATRAIDFRVRMGLNTGLVVVGAIGDNLRMDYTAVGDTTNTAARMQQLAEPGAIVVAEASQKLIAPYFATRALGAVPVKGKSQPVAAYELLKALEGVTRLDARAARGLSPFVGRDDALETLARAWAQVRSGRGQAVSVEALLRYLLAVDPGDPAVAALDPVQRRARVVTAIHRLTATGSRRRPIVLVVEDAHWIDGASEDFLKSLTENLPGMAVLLIVTYRPVYAQPFGDRTYYWRIGLQPVDEDAAAHIVRATLGVAELPRELAVTIAGKAEGNPFFLEEIGRTLEETGAVRVENGRLVLAQAASTITVPETVQDVIAARLDRLADSQKRTVQTASVIGREFALALLKRVSDLQEQLEQSLSELKRVELIYQKGGFGELEYVFKHALTQDVAYASLLQSERRRLHALIGAAIEEVYAGRLEERTEELVYHFTRGEVWDKVVRHARVAAERAAALCVDDKAVEFYEIALEALQQTAETPETARAGIDLRLAMRAPLWRAGRLDPLYERFREAEDLATRHGVAEVLDTIYAYLVQYHWAKGNPDEALTYGRRCLERAAARGELGLAVTGHYYLSRTYQTVGRHREAVGEAEALLSLLAGREHERFGLSGLPFSGACALAAFSLAELGDTTGALAMIERGRAAVDAAGHQYSAAVIDVNHAFVLARAGRLEEAVRIGESVVATCREKKFAGQFMLGACALAHAYAALGRGREAAALAGAAIERPDTAQAFSDRAWMYSTKALGHVAAGELDEAARDVARGLEFAERHRERGWEAWTRYVAGLIAERRGDRAGAARDVDEAQEIAEELGMRPLLERCRAALAKLG